jgi:CRP/FNR family transcriptional regulator, cyclic AMP receptor protein
MIDPSGFFPYPNEPAAPEPPQLLAAKSEREWATFLGYTSARRFRRDNIVLRTGEQDRALYVLVDGRLEGSGVVVAPITIVGERAFFDGEPRTVTVRALSDGELLRLGWDAFEALAAREPLLARDLLIDVGRILAARLQGGTG